MYAIIAGRIKAEDIIFYMCRKKNDYAFMMDHNVA